LLRFKLHLRPTVNGPEIPPLPHRKSATSVLADFLRYLFECAKTFIEETHPNGRALWVSLQKHIRFVIAHPNGWEGKQQSQMRDAAVVAGLIPNSDAGHERLRFVTEGEASLHFCIQNGLATQAIDVGYFFVRCLILLTVCRAGTVSWSLTLAEGRSISVRTVWSRSRTVTRNIRKSRHHNVGNHLPVFEVLFNLFSGLFQGSIYVTQRARDYLEGDDSLSKISMY
jgi:hypothetical protein